MGVVTPAAELDVFDRRRAAIGIRLDVMEFEEGAFVAATAAGGHERAEAEISLDDGAFDVGRDVP